MWIEVGLCVVVYASLTNAYHIELVPVAQETFYKDGAKHESVRYKVMPSTFHRKQNSLKGQIGPGENKHVYNHNNYDFYKTILRNYNLQQNFVNHKNDQHLKSFYLPHSNHANEKYLEYVRKYKLENSRIQKDLINQNNIHRYLVQAKSKNPYSGNFEHGSKHIVYAQSGSILDDYRYPGTPDYEAYVAKLESVGRTYLKPGQEMTHETATEPDPGTSEYIGSNFKQNADKGINTRMFSKSTVLHAADSSTSEVEGNTYLLPGPEITNQDANRSSLHTSKHSGQCLRCGSKHIYAQSRSILDDFPDPGTPEYEAYVAKLKAEGKTPPKPGQEIIPEAATGLDPGTSEYISYIMKQNADKGIQPKMFPDLSNSEIEGTAYLQAGQEITNPGANRPGLLTSKHIINSILHQNAQMRTHITETKNLYNISSISKKIPNLGIDGNVLTYPSINDESTDVPKTDSPGHIIHSVRIPDPYLETLNSKYKVNVLDLKTKENSPHTVTLSIQDEPKNITPSNPHIDRSTHFDDHDQLHFRTSPWRDGSHALDPVDNTTHKVAQPHKVPEDVIVKVSETNIPDISNENNVGLIENQNLPVKKDPEPEVAQNDVESHAYSALVDDRYYNPDPYLNYVAYNPSDVNNLKIPQNDVETAPVNDYYYEHSAKNNSQIVINDVALLDRQPVHEPNVASDENQGIKVPQNEAEITPIDDYYQPDSYRKTGENNPNAANYNTDIFDGQSVHIPNISSDETQGIIVPQYEVKTVPNNDYYEPHWDSGTNNQNAENKAVVSLDGQPVHALNVASVETQGLEVLRNEDKSAPINDYSAKPEPYWDSGKNIPKAVLNDVVVLDGQPVREPNDPSDETQGSEIPQNEDESALINNFSPKPDPHWNSEENNPKKVINDVVLLDGKPVHEPNIVSDENQEINVPQNEVETTPINDYYELDPSWNSRENNPNATNHNIDIFDLQPVYVPNISSDETQVIKVPQNKVEIVPNNGYYEPHLDSRTNNQNAENEAVVLLDGQPVHAPNVASDETQGSEVPQNEAESAYINDYSPKPELYWDSEKNNPKVVINDVVLLDEKPVHELNVANDEIQGSEVTLNEDETPQINVYYETDPYWNSGENNPKVVINVHEAVHESKVASDDTQGTKVSQTEVETVPINDYYKPHWDSGTSNPKSENEAVVLLEGQPIHEPYVVSDETLESEVPQNEDEAVHLKVKPFIYPAHPKSIQNVWRDLRSLYNLLLLLPPQSVDDEQKSNIPYLIPNEAVDTIYGQKLKTENNPNLIHHNNYYQHFTFKFSENSNEKAFLLKKYLLVVADLNKLNAPADVINEITFRILNYIITHDPRKCESEDNKKISEDVDDIVSQVLKKHFPSKRTRRP